MTNSKIAYFFHYVGKLFLQTTHGTSCLSTFNLNFRIKTCVKSTDLGSVSVSLAGTVHTHNWDFELNSRGVIGISDGGTGLATTADP